MTCQQMPNQLINPTISLPKALLASFLFFFGSSIIYVMSGEKLVAVNFEVFGRVQGVFFRKYTAQEAKKLGLRGWCMNTDNDTVKGILEGSPTKISEMKTWLQKTGSPQSRIDKAVFSNEHDIANYNFDSFSIKR